MLIEEQTRFLNEVAEILIRDADTNHRTALAEARHELNMWREGRRTHATTAAELNTRRQRIAELEASAADDQLVMDDLRASHQGWANRASDLVAERDRLREQVTELERDLRHYRDREVDLQDQLADAGTPEPQPETYHYWVGFSAWKRLDGPTLFATCHHMRSTPILTYDDSASVGESLCDQYGYARVVLTAWPVEIRG